MRKARVALARRLAIITHAMLRDGTEVRAGLGHQSTRQEGRIELPRGATPREQTTARIVAGANYKVQANYKADCDFNLAALHPAYPIKCRTSAQRTQASPERRHQKSLPPLTH